VYVKAVEDVSRLVHEIFIAAPVRSRYAARINASKSKAGKSAYINKSKRHNTISVRFLGASRTEGHVRGFS